MTANEPEFDRGAAVMRSMLGGVVAGPFYLAVGLVLALTRTGFDLTRDALSLLLLGDLGWLQAMNLILAGAMSIIAGIGFARTPDWSRAVATLVGVYGACLVLSAIFPPDPTDAFPPGSAGGVFTTSGILHFVFGGIAFLSLGAAAILAHSWMGRHDHPRGALWSRVAGVAVIIAFAAGGALSAKPTGVALLWLTVVTTWTWLALTSITAYRTVPHPVIARRS